jgi:protein arginine N-methyltransferase 1
MNNVTTYSLAGYGEMIADQVRMEAYDKALRHTVKPDSVVLDIGTGTGIFALLACRYGARKVYAIEPSECIEVARKMASANGYCDRIVFIQDLSTRVKLPEPADVIISDLRGVLPVFQHHFASIADARRRFLALGGAIIPRQDTLWAALLSAPDVYNKNVADFYENNRHDFNLKAAMQHLTNSWVKVSKITPEQLFVLPQQWATLDYTAIESTDLSGELTWTAEKTRTVHGLCLWFDAMLTDGIRFSNAPGEQTTIYGQAFFPWSTPLDLKVGDKITIALKANLVGEDYLWRWDTCVFAAETGQLKASFKQSTFYSTPLSPAQLRKSSDKFVPALNEEGQIDHFILEKMKAGTPLGEIARQASSQFPQRFPKWQQALTHVGELSQKYSE